ncbi:hypothetical protein KIPB_011019, partial [Kipferlia bialata]|eukprot:g11019.t1
MGEPPTDGSQFTRHFPSFTDNATFADARGISYRDGHGFAVDDIGSAPNPSIASIFDMVPDLDNFSRPSTNRMQPAVQPVSLDMHP